MISFAVSRPKMKKMKRTIINTRLLKTAWAIFRYVPKSFFAKPINGLNFYKPETIADFVRRVQNLTPDSHRQWGTMLPVHMLHHLNLAIGGALGFYELLDESYWVSRTLWKWILIHWFSEQPVGLLLPLNFVIPHDQEFDFVTEQNKLVEILNAAGNATIENYGPHPLFGKMTLNEWGRLSIIHIDYHLRQFSV
jgi:hypothetical protein